MNDLKKKPCSKCPYALGLVHTVANPCPQCMLNGYQSYQWFQKSYRENNRIPKRKNERQFENLNTASKDTELMENRSDKRDIRSIQENK